MYRIEKKFKINGRNCQIEFNSIIGGCGTEDNSLLLFKLETIAFEKTISKWKRLDGLGYTSYDSRYTIVNLICNEVSWTLNVTASEKKKRETSKMYTNFIQIFYNINIFLVEIRSQ